LNIGWLKYANIKRIGNKKVEKKNPSPIPRPSPPCLTQVVLHLSQLETELWKDIYYVCN